MYLSYVLLIMRGYIVRTCANEQIPRYDHVMI